MALLHFPPFSAALDSSPVSSLCLPWRKGRSARLSSLIWDFRAWGGGWRLRRKDRLAAVMAMSDSPAYKMNLNEYMVTLERPLGIRFALSLEGKVFVHSLRKGGNAEGAKLIMVGDTLKKASDATGGAFCEIKDLSDAEKMLKDMVGSLSLVLERPFSPYPIQQLSLDGDYHVLFNSGKVPFATWNGGVLASNLQGSCKHLSSGFVIYSPKLLNHGGWKLLLLHDRNKGFDNVAQKNKKYMTEVVGFCSEEKTGDVEWTYGGFPVEEYVKALERAKGEFYYNHSLGMQLSKITEQIFVGSCIQTERDLYDGIQICHIRKAIGNLAEAMGITAVLNFQSESERSNWGINSQAINESSRHSNILMVTYPIRDGDSLDLRKKLPFCVGLLLRLLRKNYRILVTCTTGFDRSPACIIAYLHWIQDTALHAAHNFVTGFHSCRPDRAAIVWATWDLIAMAEAGKSEGPPTHVVNFVWSSGCREGEEVYLVGDFTGNWKDTIKAVHKGGSRHEAVVRLRHGKYTYKFIVGGQWRHSTALPTVRDERGNVNNVIQVGDVARIRPTPNELQIKDSTVVKVIERQLTEDERFVLAFAARRFAFAICPIKLTPK
ncbi:Phosphoglucan phosphatase LSF1, chloroplastic [Apostasia shenzhenica]|uniref:Phosphoglucan phosphatase LSF1, chloroplastic n=1 Tax=Apostasia shenzhenica TaxID=1088818 RepID=A0A2I0BFJ8_9ASPA|nr:Phosphoglucan phosphatase LSF1, chloroplastic [Apostasia shenzhenica]